MFVATVWATTTGRDLLAADVSPCFIIRLLGQDVNRKWSRSILYISVDIEFLADGLDDVAKVVGQAAEPLGGAAFADLIAFLLGQVRETEVFKMAVSFDAEIDRVEVSLLHGDLLLSFDIMGIGATGTRRCR